MERVLFLHFFTPLLRGRGGEPDREASFGCTYTGQLAREGAQGRHGKEADRFGPAVQGGGSGGPRARASKLFWLFISLLGCART